MNKGEFLHAATKGGAVIFVSVVARALVGFGTQVLLSRMLAPELFGQIAFAATIALFPKALTDLRGDTFAIQQKVTDPHHAVDVAFTLELIVAAFSLTAVFALAPWIMNALGKGDFTLYVQLLAFSLLHSPFSRPRALLERNLSFVRSTVPFVLAQVVAAISSITLAFLGYGIWSLLWWRLCPLIGETVILWVSASRCPRLKWDFELARQLLRFSWPLVVSALLSFFCYNIDYFIIGQYLVDGKKQLGYYWLGFQAATYFLVVRQVLYGVLFPLFSRLDDAEFKALAYRRVSQAVTGVFLVFVILLVSFARDIIVAFYGRTWEPAVFPFQIIIIVVMIRATNANTGYYFHSGGNTKPELVSSVLTSLLLAPAAYAATVRFGINGTALAVLLVQMAVTTVIYERYIKRISGHGVMHFFLWPCTIAGATLALSLIAREMNLSPLVRCALVTALLILAYYFVLRPVLRDGAAVFKIVCQLRQKPSAVRRA